MIVEKLDCVVIGAGVVGLACAAALAAAGREVLIIEAEARFGEGISSRNSEVIHAGLYYPSGSLKAKLCIRGKALLYRYCAERSVPHDRCGKLIVATTAAEVTRLQAIEDNARRCGVSELAHLEAAALAALEPALNGVAALHSTSTGIIDSHALMLALLGDAQSSGALLALRTPVIGGAADSAGLILELGGAEPCSVRARTVINAAGLGAVPLARGIRGFAHTSLPDARFAKGSYFVLQGKSPFSHLIYPLPEPGGLGVHLTLDLAGQARFGPDVEWLTEPDYHVSDAKIHAFEASIRRYWPGLGDGRLVAGYAGVRPKISGPNEAAADFRIDGPEAHGIPGWINLFGIESPGLTASLAIAEEVATRLAP